MSLSSEAQLGEKQAQEIMGRAEKCSQGQFVDQLIKAYMAGGMLETDAKTQASNDLISVLDYQNETSMTPEQRINMNMNNAVSLYTGATDIKDWKEAREKIRNVNKKYQQCEKNNDEKYCKKIFNINGGLSANKGLTSGFDALRWSENQLGSARNIVHNARDTAYKHVERGRCNTLALSKLNFGLTASVSFSNSVGLYVGFGGQSSLTAYLVKSGTKFYAALYGEYGFSIRTFDGYVSIPPSPSGTPPVFFGIYSGWGTSFGISNTAVDGPNGLTGSFDKINGDIGNGIYSWGTSISYNGSLTAGGVSVKLGKGFGIDLTQYPTETVLIGKILIWDACP